MLVLSRKEGQSVELPELNVVIRVVNLKSSRVQLGIEAPREISVNRSEKPFDPKSREDSQAFEIMRMRDELTRVEAELAALAELAAAKDQPTANQIAAESIRRLEGIQRSLHIAKRQNRSEATPIAELVKVRTDVLEQLRQRQLAQPQGDESVTWSDPTTDRPTTDRPTTDRPTHVRQSPAGYSVPSSRLAPTCSVV